MIEDPSFACVPKGQDMMEHAWGQKSHCFHPFTVHSLCVGILCLLDARRHPSSTGDLFVQACQFAPCPSSYQLEQVLVSMHQSLESIRRSCHLHAAERQQVNKLTGHAFH